MQEDAIFVSNDSHAESGTAKELAELKAMLRRQDAEMERLRTQLATTEIEKRKDTEIPDLNLAGIEEFLKKERVTVWMKDACPVLKQYVTAVPTPSRPADVGGKQGEQLSLGDALVYRMWKVLIVAHATYVKRYSPGQASGPKGKSEFRRGHGERRGFVEIQEYSIQEARRGGLLVIQGRRVDPSGRTAQPRLP